MCKQQPKVIEIAEAFKKKIIKGELTSIEENLLSTFIKLPLGAIGLTEFFNDTPSRTYKFS